MPFCNGCGTGHSRLDNYCRHCGISLRDDIPAPVVETSAIAIQSPASTQLAAWLPNGRAIAQGAAVVVAGAALEVLRRRLLADLLPVNPLSPLSSLLRARPSGAIRKPTPPARPIQPVSETVETIIIQLRRRG